MTFDEARLNFEKEQLRFAKFGAYDTEPRGVFKELMCQLADGEDPEVPRSVSGWQLFSDMPGNEKAAAALADAAEAVIAAAKADVVGLTRYIRDEQL